MTTRASEIRNLPRFPPTSLVRVFLLAVLAVVATGWAIVRDATHRRAPMLVPASSASGAADEVPAPELVPTD